MNFGFGACDLFVIWCFEFGAYFIVARSGKTTKRIVKSDPVYKSPVVTHFINRVMRCGKKKLAERIVYGALQKLGEKTGKDPLTALRQVISNVSPSQEVRSRRVGGATYQIPMPVKGDRKEALAMRWLITLAKKKKGRPMVEKLADELFTAYQGTGDAVKKKENTHKMADANKAFAHFRW